MDYITSRKRKITRFEWFMIKITYIILYFGKGKRYKLVHLGDDNLPELLPRKLIKWKFKMR